MKKDFYKTEHAQDLAVNTIKLLTAFINGETICRKVDNSTYETYPSTDAIFPIPFGEYLTLEEASRYYDIIDRRDEIGV